MLNLKSENLAINGGKKIRERKWLDNFTTGEEEKQAVIKVLDSGYLSLFEGSHTPDEPFSFRGGPEVQALENEWCEFYNIDHSIAMNSATSGLFAAIGALEIGYGDEVIVSPYTMTACALAPLIYGAIPVFADIDPNTGCLDPESVEAKITKKTKCILIVHQFGFPANMKKIMEIANKYSLKIIEDCAQAHSAKHNGKYVGTIGDIGVFSLNVNKTIQSGEGGVCVTKNPDIAYRLQLIRNHGEAVVGPANYLNITNIAGYNYRMTELCAAISRQQLKKLNQITNKRLELVNYFKTKLKGNDCLKPLSGTASYGNVECEETYYVFPLIYTGEDSIIKRNTLVKALNAEGCLFYQGYVKPLYLQPMYQQKSLYKFNYPFMAPANSETYQEYSKGTCPVAESLHYEKLIINEHIRPPHTISDINDLIRSIEKLGAYS